MKSQLDGARCIGKVAERNAAVLPPRRKAPHDGDLLLPPRKRSKTFRHLADQKIPPDRCRIGIEACGYITLQLSDAVRTDILESHIWMVTDSLKTQKGP